MTGKLALDAHKLLSAVDKAMKARGDKQATPDQFLAALHQTGYDVVWQGFDEPYETQPALRAAAE